MTTDPQRYAFSVNAHPVEVMASPKTWLMDVIRDDLRLTGTKDGCAKGHCGSCMVILDGEAVRSCLIPMKRVREHAQLQTIAGLASAGQPGSDASSRLHPIQQALVAEGVTQF